MIRNMKILCSCFIICLIISESACGGQDQLADTGSYKIKNQILPLALIATGISINSHPLKDKLQAAFPRTATNIDDYFQWAPAAIMYTSDIFNIKHRNSLFNQTKFLLISELATSAITQFLKKITGITRPNGGTLSFPSGHTCNAFTSATVLFHEYKDYCLPVAFSGYLFSSTTGVLRITNNRHWVPDVLAGAGIGIIVTNLIYYWEPFKNWDPFKKTGPDKLTILPQIDPGNDIYFVSLRIKI
jgi:membrane-associated phospholipid phosphatase